MPLVAVAVLLQQLLQRVLGQRQQQLQPQQEVQVVFVWMQKRP